MAGGKGGSTTTSVEVPEYIEEAAKRNLARADVISQIGYVPYYGPDVAAFTPTQEAAFQNVAGQAGAFGLSTPAGGAMAGVPAPQEFAGGIQGYSSAPLFEQAQADLAAKRPAQVNLMNSLFIDPFTGQVGTNVAAPIDYSQLGTAADIREANRQNDLAIAQATANQSQAGSALTTNEYNTYVNTIQEAIGDPTYNPATDVLTQSQVDAINQDQDAQLAQDAIYMNQLGNANATIGDAFTTLTGGEPSFDDPSGAGSYGGSLVTGELSTDLLGIPGLVGEVADSIYQDVDFEGAVQAQGENFAEMAGSELQDDGTYDISSWFTDTSATPTNADLAAKTETFSQMGDDLTPPPPTYDGSSEKNAAVASILKDTYGWSDEQLTSGGYEGYAESAEGVGTPAPAPAPAPSDTSFTPTFEAGVAAADDDPFGVQLPTQQQQDFASTVLAADDVSAFTAPVVDTSNDNDNFVPTTSSGATVIPTGTTIATGTVLNKKDDPVVEVDGKLYNQSNAPAPASSGGGGNDDGGGGGGGGGGCVVATHAVSSGAFTPSMKREAVVWCMNVLHDKWWGEAIRRGYRHLGRKKIEQGKAHEHYQEFRDYIAFANGKKRTLKGAINFTLRTAQFFAVGLIKKEA